MLIQVIYFIKICLQVNTNITLAHCNTSLQGQPPITCSGQSVVTPHPWVDFAGPF